MANEQGTAYNRNNEIKEAHWLALNDELVFDECFSLEHAQSLNPRYIVHEQEGIWKNPGDTGVVFHNRLYKLNLLDPAGNPCDCITYNNWRLSDWNVFRNGFREEVVSMVITPPKGSGQRKSFGHGREGLINALASFRAAASRLDPQKEIERLMTKAAEVDPLKTEVSGLKERLKKIAQLAAD